MSEGYLDDDGVSCGDLFKEPEGYYQKEKPPTFEQYTLITGETLQLRLVGHNPLWGHVLWNAAKVAAEYLEENARKVQGRHILELGAGAGLPSLVCAVLGARMVVVTDYPDQELIENLEYNVRTCNLLSASSCKIHVQGYMWGQPLVLDTGVPPSFDLLILADLVFNHSEHEKLISTIKATMKRVPESRALVFFTPHRPWLLEKDLDFYRLAEQSGLQVDKFMEKLMNRPMYEHDRGDETLRRTVYGYEISWRFDKAT